MKLDLAARIVSIVVVVNTYDGRRVGLWSGVGPWVAVCLTGWLMCSSPAWAVPPEVPLKVMPIEDPSGKALDSFFSSLAKTKRQEKGAVTRVAHYGDSIIVGDLITRTVRRLFQKRYGQGGPGFLLAGRPWPWYRRQGVKQGGSSKGWSVRTALKGGLADGFYGIGGASFSTKAKNKRVWYSSTTDEDVPVKISRIDIHYLAQPQGGDLDVLIDGEHLITVSTKGDTPHAAFHEIHVPDGPHKVELRSAGGHVRLFGVSLERQGPAVVYDSLGINGSCATVLGQIDTTHLKQQFAHRPPNLMVLAFGANESNRPLLVKGYREAMLPVLQNLRAAAPQSSCLIMATLDRGQRREKGVRTNPLIPRIVEAQKNLAFEAGCAFYNTYELMGGKMSMYRWSRKGLASSDLTHPTKEGAEVIGTAFFEALEKAHGAWATKTP